jgi:adenylosuccinate lyase
MRLNEIIKNLNIYPKNMLKNLNLTNGLFFSQRVLIELTTVGFTREEAYSLVQKHAMDSWDRGTSFYENLLNDPKISKKLPVNKLKNIFDFSYHTKRINIIFKRCLKKKIS